MAAEHILAGPNLQEILELQPRAITAADMRRFEGYIAEILSACGMDMHQAGTEKTPHRLLQALIDSTAGYEGDDKLLTLFENEQQEDEATYLSQIVEGPIKFFALCEHHALPFYGEAYVAYTANKNIIGISKLTRFVRLFAKRFTVQERMGQQIAFALETLLEPFGVAVYLQARHMCTEMRGVEENSTITRTTHWRGKYLEDVSLRSEFLQMVNANK